MAGEKTTTIKRTVAPPASKVTKGKQQDKRKYRNDDAKCSVDVGAKNRGALSGDEGLIKKGPAKAATFQSGKNKNMAKSLTDVPKDARARACAHWMEEAIQLTLKGI
uniref:Uncharacterized protein n=1 Tax=Panagrolaimus sp. ES5 TaxID=591445 RepID=A0AC34FMM2_9BILA